jgi:hypothetical protein
VCLHVLHLLMTYLMVLSVVHCSVEYYDREWERILKEPCWPISRSYPGISLYVIKRRTNTPLNEAYAQADCKTLASKYKPQASPAVNLDMNVYLFFFSYGSTAPWGPSPPHYQGFTITLRHTTFGRTPLDEGPAHRRDLTTHNIHKTQTSMP